MYAINQDGNASLHKGFKNSFRGAILIWRWLAKKYLGDIPFFTLMHENDKSLWNLAYDQSIKESHRIVLANTFDNVLVRRENLLRLIKAMRSFDKDCGDSGHIPEQADALEALLNDSNVLAIGWNQTSVVNCLWQSRYDENENEIPFNIKNDIEHWFLFEDQRLNFSKDEVK